MEQTTQFVVTATITPATPKERKAKPKQAEPRGGYPTLVKYFDLVPIADLHTALLTLADFAKETLHCRHTEKARNIRHQANVAMTFAKTLSANSNTLDSLICK